MNGDRPDELDRLVGTTGALEALVEIFEDDTESVDEALSRLARISVGAIADADAVSVTVLSDSKPRTAAHTDDKVLQLDHVQYDTDRGPCLEAAERRTPVRVAMGGEDERWPEFVTAARDASILATLSIPLVIPAAVADTDGELVGSLNVYSRNVAAFDPFDEALMSLFATSATQAITIARRWQRSRDTVTQMHTALESRAEIEQAKGVLRAVHGCSADEAFTRLVERSQHTNVKLHTLARQLLDSLSDEQTPGQ
ncbi:GAF and ANTAR domain-containing protein [Mycolicibacterium sp. GCM10028919]|uniref:GAF and ANTAR domain-containing protein n=1 Tax=Mycolicibacterium sp. GCM10028919 TaxID=3273401 RepID=UPI0036228B8C